MVQNYYRIIFSTVVYRFLIKTNTLSLLFRNFIFLSCLLLLSSSPGHSQNSKKIFITNGSFEGIPKESSNPSGWKSCGYNSSPDILPGPWGVHRSATDGKSFLGLICREDNSFESIETKLSETLKKDSCYSFKVDLSRASSYSSYNGAASIRIWGAKNSCQKSQLLVSSEPIDHYDWKTYYFSFIPNKNYDYIIIECYYKTPSLLPYKGNVLIDRLLYFESCTRA